MYISILEYALLAACFALLLPMTVFVVECVLSLLPRLKPVYLNPTKPRTCVLIPAHNEQTVLANTLNKLLPTLSADDRVLVVADNCDDDTAEMAKRLGAEVAERHDTTNRGKGYALDYGIRQLQDDPPEVLFILDADCEVESNTVQYAAALCYRTNSPVQTRNLSTAPAESSRFNAVSELGFRFKNLVRPLGYLNLGWPCHLMGTGMCLPWSAVEKVDFASGHLAEDMQLGIDIAIAGQPALFCPEVGITSTLPNSDSGFVHQRTRWEQGHLSTLFTQVPRLVRAAIKQKRLDLLMLAFDLSVPPLSLLVMSWLAVLTTSAIAWAIGASVWPLTLLTGAGMAMLTGIALGWLAHCRQQIPLRTMLSIPAYIIRKLPIYTSFFTRRKQSTWVRTDRDKSLKPDVPHSSEV